MMELEVNRKPEIGFQRLWSDAEDCWEYPAKKISVTQN
jgi:hypothetical protein